MKPWKWYEFADGYRVCCGGMTKLERQYAEAAHGPLVSITPERSAPVSCN